MLCGVFLCCYRISHALNCQFCNIEKDSEHTVANVAAIIAFCIYIFNFYSSP